MLLKRNLGQLNRLLYRATIKESKKVVKTFYKVALKILWRLLGRGFTTKTKAGFIELGWSLNHLHVNWGDLLVRETAEKYFFMNSIYKSFSGAVFGGSMLGSELYESSSKISSSKPVLAISCGIKEPIKATRIPENLRIVGVRGYRTAELISKTKVVGDPGMLSPILFELKPTISHGERKIFIPHASDFSRPSGSNFETFTTNLSYGRSSIDLLRAINSSLFVLAGSLHAGICAYACGTPFSFYRGKNSEDLFKYDDFASVHNFKLEFNEDFQAGINWFLNNDSIRRPTEIHQFQVYDDELDPFSRFTKSDIYSLIQRFNNDRNEMMTRKIHKLKSI